MMSIRRHLLVVLLTSISLVMVAGAFGTYKLALREVDQVFDYQLEQLARSLRNQAFPATYNPLPPDDEFDFVIQVWSRNGDRRYLSHPHAVLPNRGQLGFSTLETSEGGWRLFTTELRDQVIQVAQPMKVRQQLATSAALKTALPFIFLLPLLGALIWWLVGRGLAPLHRIARAVSRRTPNSLESLRLDGVPNEARPLVESINNLLERLDAALSSQRAFVADAAHELRTPLTALQLQVQLTERVETTEDRIAAMAELKHGLQRAGHVVQQLLTLAREEPGAGNPRPFAHVDLVSMAGMVAADYTLLAESRGIDLGLGESAASAPVSGVAESLRTLIANLLENAIRYTPGPGRVDIVVAIEDGRPSLKISDSGPGIPPEEREKVFDRFYRRTEFAEPGSGLGLSIVRAIADRHKASIELAESPLGGLLVCVRFPAV